LILVGDFNMHLPSLSDRGTYRLTDTDANIESTLLDTTAHFNLHPLNTGLPTYFSAAATYSSTIDYTFISENLVASYNGDWSLIENQTEKDHQAITFSLGSHIEHKHSPQANRKKWPKHIPPEKWQRFTETVEAENKSFDASNTDIEDLRAKLVLSIHQAMNLCVGRTAARVCTEPSHKHKKHFWYKYPLVKAAWKRLKRAIRHHKSLSIGATKDRVQEKVRDLKKEFDILTLQAKRNEHKATNRYYKKHGHKRFYSALNKLLSPKSLPINRRSIIIDNEPIADTEAVANELNKHFVSVSKKLPNHYDETLRQKLNECCSADESRNHSYNKQITIHELNFAIDKMPSGKAPGKDEITTEIIQHTGPHTRKFILHLFNESLRQGKLPTEWKHQLTFPVLKNQSIKHPKPSDFRPIALLSVIYKLMERILEKRLRKHAETHNWIPENQFGFRSQHSPEDALHYIRNTIEKHIQQKNTATMVTLDLAKAFDTVSRTAVVGTLINYGLEGCLLKWLHDYLTDRKQCTIVGDSLSAWLVFLSGVPQGSILAPLLFIITTASLVRALTSAYVDDTQLSSAIDPPADRQTYLQTALNAAVHEAKKIGMHFSVKENETDPDKIKSAVIVFQRPRVDATAHNNIKLYIEGKQLPVVTVVKVLGVLWDNKLSFKQHHQRRLAKASKAAAMLAGALCIMPCTQDTYLDLYKMYVRSKMEYAITITTNTQIETEKYVQQYENIQRRVLCKALGAHKSTSSLAAAVDCNILPFGLRIRQLAAKFLASTAAKPPTHIMNKLLQSLELAEAKAPRTRTSLNTALSHCKYLSIRTDFILNDTETTTNKHTVLTPTDLTHRLHIQHCPYNPHDNTYNEEKRRTVLTGCTNWYNRIANEHKQDHVTYTHGSSLECGCTGAGFLTRYENEEQTNQVPISSASSTRTADIFALSAAVAHAISEVEEKKLDTVAIFTTSKHTLHLLTHPTLITKSTPTTVIQTLTQRLTLLTDKARTYIYWIPNKCITATETARNAAISAAKAIHTTAHTRIGRAPAPIQNPAGITHTLHEVYKYIHTRMTEKYITIWRTAHTGRDLYKVKPTPKYTRALTNNLNWRTKALLCRLRHNKASLNEYRHRTRQIDSPACPHCPQTETLEHLLHECQKYELPRRTLKIKLLGFGLIIPEAQEDATQMYLNTDSTLTRRQQTQTEVISFLRATGRFSDYFLL